MTYEIQRNIPMPARRGAGRPRNTLDPSQYPFDVMEPGDSFAVHFGPNDEPERVRLRVVQHAIRKGLAVVSEVRRDHLRVWLKGRLQ